MPPPVPAKTSSGNDAYHAYAPALSRSPEPVQRWTPAGNSSRLLLPEHIPQKHIPPVKQKIQEN